MNLIKVLVGDDLAGKAKHIKRHRDWLAHRNLKKPSPANVQPVFVYQVLSEIMRQVSLHCPVMNSNTNSFAALQEQSGFARQVIARDDEDVWNDL